MASGLHSALKTRVKARISGKNGRTCGVAGLRHIGFPVAVRVTTKPPRAARSGSSGQEHRFTTASKRLTQKSRCERFCPEIKNNYTK